MPFSVPVKNEATGEATASVEAVPEVLVTLPPKFTPPPVPVTWRLFAPRVSTATLPPLRSSVAPELMLSSLFSLLKGLEAPSFSVPSCTLTSPGTAPELERVSVPSPNFVTLPAITLPEMTAFSPDFTKSSASPESVEPSKAVKVWAVAAAVAFTFIVKTVALVMAVM